MKLVLISMLSMAMGGVAGVLVTAAVDLENRLMAIVGLLLGMLAIAIGCYF